MAKRYFTLTGTYSQLNEFQRVIQTFNLKSEVLSIRTVVPNDSENIGIEVERELEEITKLTNHLYN